MAGNNVRIEKKFLQDLETVVTLGYYCTMVEKNDLDRIKLEKKEYTSSLGYPGMIPVAVVEFRNNVGGLVFQNGKEFVERFEEKHFEKLKKHGALDVAEVRFLSDPDTPRRGEVVTI